MSSGIELDGHSGRARIPPTTAEPSHHERSYVNESQVTFLMIGENAMSAILYEKRALCLSL